jgi:signal transduction histidine kinase
MIANAKRALDVWLNRDEATWGARLAAAGSILTLLYELAFLILDRGYLSIKYPVVLVLHGVIIGLYAVAIVMAANVGPWIRAHWRPIALSFSGGMIACSAAICVITKEVEPFFIALVLFLAGTGPFLCWGEGYQAVLSLIAIGAFVVGTHISPEVSVGPYQWLGIAIATAIGLFSTAFEKRLRRACRSAQEEASRGRERMMAQEHVRLAGELTSGIAHDLNHAIQDIALRLTLLAKGADTKEAYTAGVEVIQRSVEDAYQIVARVRELSSQHVSEKSETVEIGRVIGHAIGMVRSGVALDSILKSQPILIERSGASSLPMVKGSATELRQVLLNLLLNARDAMPSGGSIKVGSVVEQNSVVIRVSDEGSGISPEHIHRIFEPFFSTKGAHGTGLGLSVSKATVEKFGGSLIAANRPAGGATFTISLPIADSS